MKGLPDPFQRLKPLVEEVLTLARSIKTDLAILRNIYVELRLSNDLELLKYSDESDAIKHLKVESLIQQARTDSAWKPEDLVDSEAKPQKS